MSLFKKLFGKKQTNESASTTNATEFKVLTKPKASNFQALLEQNGAFSFEKQKKFQEITGNYSWNINLNNGLISFGDNHFTFEVIGSLSFTDYSWMWGWANDKAGIPPNLLEGAAKLKSIGTQNKIEKLTNGHFSVTEGFEHKMGIVATGLLDADAYFCANYGKGTMVVTINKGQIPKIEKNKLAKVLTTFPQFISSFDVNHKQAFLSYLIDREFEIKEKDNENTVEGLKNGKIITGLFDELDRIKNLKGTL